MFELAVKAGKAQTDPETGMVLRNYAKLLYKENRFDDVKNVRALQCDLNGRILVPKKRL